MSGRVQSSLPPRETCIRNGVGVGVVRVRVCKSRRAALPMRMRLLGRPAHLRQCTDVALAGGGDNTGRSMSSNPAHRKKKSLFEVDGFEFILPSRCATTTGGCEREVILLCTRHSNTAGTHAAFFFKNYSLVA